MTMNMIELALAQKRAEIVRLREEIAKNIINMPVGDLEKKAEIYYRAVREFEALQTLTGIEVRNGND